MLAHEQIRSIEKKIADLETQLQSEIHTMAFGGAVKLTQATPLRSRDLKSVDRWDIVERKIVDRDEVLITKAEFDEVRVKLGEVESLTRAVASIAQALSLAIQKANDVDTLASQVFIGLVNVAKEIGLDCRLDDRGDLVVTGIAAHAAESLALSQFVRRRRLQRGE
jgi:hypothetical protein